MGRGLIGVLGTIQDAASILDGGGTVTMKSRGTVRVVREQPHRSTVTEERGILRCRGI